MVTTGNIMKKVSGNILMTLCLATLLTGTALAQGHGGHRGKGGGGSPSADNGAWNLNAEQRSTYDKIMSEYDTRITPLRDQMWSEHTELKALSGKPDSDPESISKLVRSMDATRIRLRQEREILAQRLENELGIRSGFGCGDYRDGRGGRHGGRD